MVVFCGIFPHAVGNLSLKKRGSFPPREDKALCVGLTTCTFPLNEKYARVNSAPFEPNSVIYPDQPP
jgi:hypothetical protein